MKSLELYVKKIRKYSMVEEEFDYSTTTQQFGDITWVDNNTNNYFSLTFEYYTSQIGLLPKNIKNLNKNFLIKFSIDFDPNLLNLDYFYDYLSFGYGCNIQKVYIPGNYEYFTCDSYYGNQFSFSIDAHCVINSDTITVSNLEYHDVTYTSLNINQNEQIKITKTLKDIRDPDKNGGNYSKTFLLPVTKKNQEFFEYFDHDDLKNSTVDISYECYINYDGINNLYGSLVLDKLIIGSDGEKYFQVIFIGENSTLFKKLSDNYLYQLSPTTYQTLTAENVISGTTRNGINAYNLNLANSGVGMLTYGLFERGEDLISLSGSNAITQSSYEVQNGYTGYTADSFTPAFWNWWLFREIHTRNGYTLDADDLYEDVNFMYMVMPITRKNFWTDPDYIDVEDNIVEEWLPVVSGTQSIYGISQYVVADPLSSNVANDKMLLNSYYTPNNLSIVRQKLDYSFNYTLEGAAITTGSTNFEIQPIIKIYVQQEYGYGSTATFSKILIHSEVIPNVGNINTAQLIQSGSFNGTTDYIAFWYENTTSAQTHFSVDISINLYQATGYVLMDHDIDGVISTHNDGDEYKLRVDRYPGSQIGTFSYPQDITEYSFVKDMMNMFNLIVDVDETQKIAKYRKWNDFNLFDIKDYSKNLIMDKKIEKSFTNYITPSSYNYKFKIDENDYYTNIEEGNPTELTITTTNNYNNSNNQVIEINSNFLYETNMNSLFNSHSLTNNTLRGDNGEKLTGDSAINYDFSKNYYSYCDVIVVLGNLFTIWSFDLLTAQPTNEILYYKNNISDLYNHDNIWLSYETIDSLYVTSGFTGITLYDEYYKDIIELINAKNTYILTAYFYLNTLEYYELSFYNKIRIGNQLFLINKIFDWYPDSPTKIELIKITNIN